MQVMHKDRLDNPPSSKTNTPSHPSIGAISIFATLFYISLIGHRTQWSLMGALKGVFPCGGFDCILVEVVHHTLAVIIAPIFLAVGLVRVINHRLWFNRWKSSLAIFVLSGLVFSAFAYVVMGGFN